jgi:GNAT superfamily N-acetyltransferase
VHHPRSPVVTRVHAATPADWRVLRRLRLRALEESPIALLGDPAVERSWDAAAWQSKCVDEEWFIARHGRHPVGLARFGTRQDPAEFMHLESMWVDPRFRRAGVATVLASEIERVATSWGEAHLGLWIFSDNVAAATFYRRLGYRGPWRRQVLRRGSHLAVEEEFHKRLRGAAPHPG